jgi:DNA-binding IclR family transcriptional regulator
VESVEGRADDGKPGTNGLASKARERGSVQSVDRALTLLEALARSGGGVALTDLSTSAQLNISTCHHLLATLVKWGYVAKAPGRRYALGARGLHLGHAFLKQVDLPRRAQPFVERINEETGESVHLAVLQGDSVITLLRREGRHAVRVDTGAIGTSDAPHATATGKAMLAWLPEHEIRRILSQRGMPRFTPNTISEPDALIEELRLVRRNGHHGVADTAFHEARCRRGHREDGLRGPEHGLEALVDPGHDRLDLRAAMADHRPRHGREDVRTDFGRAWEEELAESHWIGVRREASGVNEVQACTVRPRTSVPAPGPPIQMCSALPSTDRAASFVTSERVGCA